MEKKLYECYEAGVITEKDYEFPAQFSTAKKYSVLYKEELPRFLKDPLHIYGVPHLDTSLAGMLFLTYIGITIASC